MPQTPRCDTAALVDSRFEDGRRFLAALPAGVEPFEMKGDISQVWYGGLSQWAHRPGAKRLFGFTKNSDWFVASRLCASLRMLSKRLAEHDSRRGDVLTHTLTFKPPNAVAERLRTQLWPAALATLDHEAAAPTTQPVVIRTEVRRTPDYPGYLVSWVIDSATGLGAMPHD
jgi:hypothetical protein